MSYDSRSASKQSLNTFTSSTDNDSFVTANSKINSSYKFNNEEKDILYQARGMGASVKPSSGDQVSNRRSGSSFINDSVPRYSYNATPKLGSDEQFISTERTPVKIDIASSPTIKRDLTITRHSYSSSENPVKAEVTADDDTVSAIKNVTKNKRVRATSSYYEPMDDTTFEDVDHLKNPLPNIEYRKTYALTNEYKPPGAIDSEFLDDRIDAESKEINDSGEYDTTSESLAAENIKQAKENLRQSMLLSESVFDNQNAILEKESLKKASIIRGSTHMIPILEKNKMSIIKDAAQESEEEIDESMSLVFQNNQLELRKEDFNHLFIISTKNFDKNTLEEEEDKNVCLSFDCDELAFVHAVEESGWGEVTIIKTLERGWVPLNYFTDCIKPLEIFLPKGEQNGNATDKIVELRATILSRQYLAPLFQAAGRFLVNPVNDIKGNGQQELDISSVNSIQKAIKLLLASTGCISRSNEIVAKKLLVKKTRKRLLADWYSISLKADKYKGSSNTNKILTLKKMIFQLLRRAYLFYNIWSIEVQTFENEKRLMSLKAKNMEITQQSQNLISSSSSGEPLNLPVNITYLKHPPMAQKRLNEVNSFIFQYIGIILGRMDLIENNSAGYEVLEYIIRQIILLLRELLYISKSCSLLINERYNNQYENNLDSNLDPLLALVSELVSKIKIFINKMFDKLKHNENYLIDASAVVVDDKDDYKQSPEAMEITNIISKMTTYIANCIVSCNNYLRVLGDFQLGEEKKYPNFFENSITVNDFIKICSKTLLDQIKEMEWKIVQDKLTINKSLARYSIIQNGLLSDKNLMLNNNGVDYLKELLDEDNTSSKETSLLKDKLLEKFTIQEASDFQMEKAAKEHELNKINDRSAMFQELEFDEISQQLVSGTLRSIICYLTDEIVYQKHNFNSSNSLSKNDQLLISTFFMNFKMFTDSKTLISLLVTRFDENEISKKYEKRDFDQAIFTNWQSQLRHRKRLVLKFLRTWLESYWHYKSDYSCLPILINFLNETCNKFLPLESKSLMTIVSKIMLASNTKDSVDFVQLVPKSFRNLKINSMMLRFSEDLSLNERDEQIGDEMIEEYDLLEKENNEMLPVPISGLGTSNLLTPKEFVEVKDAVEQYKDELKMPDGLSSIQNMAKLWGALISEHFPLTKSSHVMLCDLNNMEVAKQLTLIEACLFSKIEVDEFLNVDLDNISNTSKNIKRLIDFTNEFSNYILESILSGETTSVILKRFNSWLKIALSCFYYKNFNSLACIMTTLQNHNISRMKFIWNNLKGKDLDLYTKLINIMDPTSNYKNYRIKLKWFTRMLKKNYQVDNDIDVNPDGNNVVVIPFLNIFLQDLIMISEVNSASSSLNPNKKVILISKFYKVTHILEKIQELQFFIVDNLAPLMSEKDILGKNINGPVEGTSATKEFITNIPILQLFIFLDFWSVNYKYLEDPERAYKLLNR